MGKLPWVLGRRDCQISRVNCIEAGKGRKLRVHTGIPYRHQHGFGIYAILAIRSSDNDVRCACYRWSEHVIFCPICLTDIVNPHDDVRNFKGQEAWINNHIPMVCNYLCISLALESSYVVVVCTERVVEMMRRTFCHAGFVLDDMTAKSCQSLCFHTCVQCPGAVRRLAGMGINPLEAKFSWGNKNTYLHFMPFRHINMTRAVEILPQVRKELTYST